MKKTRFIILFLLLIAGSGSGQDSLKPRRIKVLPVPALGYAPETRGYIGAVALFTIRNLQDTGTRTSNAKLEFNYTQNRQIILESEWSYFFTGEKWFTKGRLHYSQYPDLYYGVGGNTPDSNKIVFNSNRFVFEGNFLKRLGNQFFGGAYVRYMSYSRVSRISGAPLYGELSGSSTTGVGAAVLKDTRNSLLTPTTGYYILVQGAYNFYNSNYVDALLDARCYYTLKGKYTLALRVVNDLNFNRPPFYDYAFLGGDKFVRGYYFGRYRDNCLSALQAELRLHLFWRLGLAVFGGYSGIYKDPSDVNCKYNYGTGLRFMVDKKDRTNLRLDYAIGEGGSNGFYIAFGESF